MPKLSNLSKVIFARNRATNPSQVSLRLLDMTNRRYGIHHTSIASRSLKFLRKYPDHLNEPHHHHRWAHANRHSPALCTHLNSLKGKKCQQIRHCASHNIFDIGVIGAGAVGLATARQMTKQYPSSKIAVLEQMPQVAQHQSKNNSGVVHSGIYYAPDSKRGRLCAKGAQMMYEYCREQNVKIDQCGKLIVAVEESELDYLQQLFQRGVQNNVSGLEMIGPNEISKIEPHCRGIRAIYSPLTGIADFSQVAQSYAREFRQTKHNHIFHNFRVSQIIKTKGQISIQATSGEVVTVQRLITCAGNESDRVSTLAGGKRDPAVVPIGGEWMVLKPQYQHLPYLGVHFTRKLSGEIWIGPNAVLSGSRYGYNYSDFNAKDMWDALSYAGFHKFIINGFSTGLQELRRSLFRSHFLPSLKKFIPEIEMSHIDLAQRPSGVRAMALDAEGKLIDDFYFETVDERVLNVRNAPSPAATCSLILAQQICEEAQHKILQ